MSGLERINPPELARPAGFSHAVLADTGRIVFLAGQTALDAEGRIVGDGVVAQFEQALGNLLTALRAAGGRARAPGHADDLHRRHGGLPRPRPRDRRRLAAAGGHRLPGDGRDRHRPAVGRRGLVEVQGIAALAA